MYKRQTDEVRSAVRNRRIGFVFQNFNLLPRANALKNVMVPLIYGEEKTKNAKERAMEMLAMVGMDGRADHRPNELSGGQKRRVAIAGVIAMEPEVLVLDEPSAGLDPQGREELLANIREFHRARGTTVVLVSHSMEEIARNVGRIVVMRDAHVYMDGTPRQVFARAEELEQAGLDVPQVTELVYELQKAGMPLDGHIISEDACVDAILKCMA